MVGLLRFLNDPTTTRAVLDYDVRLDARAATGLVQHRDGLDGVRGTGDDNPYDSLSEVYSVRWVGDDALSRLLDYSRAAGWIPDGSDLLGIWEGVSFTVEEADMTLSLVNTATEYVLDNAVALDRRVVASILAERPFHAIAELAAVPQIGEAALTELKAYALQLDLEDDTLGTDQSDGSFVLTPDLADYYLDVMLTVLGDDREYFEELADIAPSGEDVDRLLTWIEVELEREIRDRVGRVFPSEQDLLDELFTVLESLQDRARQLLLN